jgi:hypothetical protein
MKKLGDILSAFFDEETVEKAKEYSSLFSSWASLTAKCGIPQAAAHSRITGLEKSLLLVEADHPGWIQILQTKQKELLDEVQKRFPGFFTTGIALRLGRPETAAKTADSEPAAFAGIRGTGGPHPAESPDSPPPAAGEQRRPDTGEPDGAATSEEAAAARGEATVCGSLPAYIKDEKFRVSLEKLKESIGRETEPGR